MSRMSSSRSHRPGEVFKRCLWLDPVHLAGNIGFSAHELNRLESLVVENQQRLLEAWDAHIGSRCLLNA